MRRRGTQDSVTALSGRDPRNEDAYFERAGSVSRRAAADDDELDGRLGIAVADEEDDATDYGSSSPNGNREPGSGLGYRAPDTQSVLAAICPYLLAEDGAWRSARPVREHRCTAVRPPAALPFAKQRRLCLVEAHRACPAFQAAQERRAADLAAFGISTGALAARQTRPLTRTIPVALERPTAITGPTAMVEAYRRLGRVGIAGLILVGLLLVVFARFVSPGGSPAATPTPSPIVGGVATPQPTAAPTTPAPTSPPPSAAPTPTRPARTAAPTPITYTVRRGDSLGAIAERYDTTVPALQDLNNIAPGEVIQPGQKVKIPVPGAPTPTARVYVVQRGDTLTSIAERFDTSVDTIKQLNNLESGFIRTGQRLRVP